MSEPISKRTRSGRTVKEPKRYEPVEKVTDDYAEDEYDSNVDLDASDDELDEQLIGSDDDESEEEDDDEEDADARGNLKDFVAYSDEEDSDYEDDDESEYESDEYSEEEEETDESDDSSAADQEEKSVPVE